MLSVFIQWHETSIFQEIKKEPLNSLLLLQGKARNFYEKHGYSCCGEMDLDEKCPHIWMCKKIGEKE